MVDDIDLGFHDDQVLSVLIEPEEHRATLRVQTYSWIEDTTVPSEDGKVYRAKADKVVKITMKLSEAHTYFEGNLGTIYPTNDIFEIGIKDNILHVALNEGLLEFHIDSYEMVKEE